MFPLIKFAIRIIIPILKVQFVAFCLTFISSGQKWVLQDKFKILESTPPQTWSSCRLPIWTFMSTKRVQHGDILRLNLTSVCAAEWWQVSIGLGERGRHRERNKTLISADSFYFWWECDEMWHSNWRSVNLLSQGEPVHGWIRTGYLWPDLNFGSW